MTGTVRVVNPSDKPLYVSHVATSCGCTSTGRLSFVPARGSVPLAVTFDSSGRPGAIEKQVSIFITETPDEPITLSLGGTVKTEWRVSPSGILELGTIPGGETKTATVSIHRVSGGAVAFAKPLASDGVRATITPDAGFKVATVSVMAVASRLPGAKQVTMTLTPTDVSLPSVLIPVSYTASGQFITSPDLLNFGLVSKSSKTVELTAILSTVVPGPPPDFRVVSAPKGVSARVERSSDAQATLHVTISPGAFLSGSVLNERIVIATGSEKQPRIVVPVLAVYGNATAPSGSVGFPPASPP